VETQAKTLSTLRLVYVFARAEASTCTLSSIYNLPCDNFVQKLVTQVKKLSFYVTAFKKFAHIPGS
jgi:hypothetical protein